MLTEDKIMYTDVYPTNSNQLPDPQLDKAHLPFKMLYHEEMLKQFVGKQEINPIHLRIGITGSCNMRCNFCNFHSNLESEFYDLFSYKDYIPTNECKQLLTDFKESGGKAVTFCGSGECTIHPGYVEICEHAYAIGLKIGLITNGSRISRENIRECLGNTHTWVRIGLNAGTPDTFARVTHQRPEIFSEILATIPILRKNAKAPDFKIGLNYVITVENYTELENAAREAYNANACYIRYEPEFYSAHGHRLLDDVMAEIGNALGKLSNMDWGEFEVSIPKLDRGPMDKTEVVEGNFSRCHYSRFVTAIGADANLYPCPQVHLNSRYKIGNVIEKGYAQVLEGGPRREWESSNPLRTDLCKTCFYRPQNELLEALLEGKIDLAEAIEKFRQENPTTLHADFV